jgi:hypothetical protein
MKAIVHGKTSKGTDYYRFEMNETEFVGCDDNSEGCCVFCGETAYGVEPDARKYVCESCEKPGVYGMQELLLMGLVKFSEEDDE